MKKLIADENFKRAIFNSLIRQNPELDLIRVQDVGLIGIEDPDLLAWAAQEDRVLLTHDVNTITKYAYDRLIAGLPMPGVIEVSQNAPIGQIVEDILLLVQIDEELTDQVRYVPL